MKGVEQVKKDIESTGKLVEKASGAFEKTGEKVEAFGVSLDKLNRRISGQQNKLELLKKKYTDLYLTQGETSDETKKVAAEIEKLSSELMDNKKALGDAKKAADSFDKTLEDVGEEGKEVAEAISGSWKDVLSGFLKTQPVLTKVVAGVTAVGTAVVAVGKAMNDITNETREYRLEMGKLDSAFSAAGHSAITASETYRTLYSIIGETDQAVEAAQQISLLAESAEEAAQWADLAAGVVGRFGDALQPETFFEAANETFSLNEATGAYVQMLEGCQMSVDEFNKGLQACTTAEEKQAYMLGVTKKALGAAGEAYKKNNKDVIAATAAQDKLNAATARWGEIFEPIVTFGKEALADLINLSVDLLGPVEETTEAIAGTSEATEEAAAKVEKLRGELSALQEVPIYLWTEEQAQRHTELVVALEKAEVQYEELAEAERLAAEEASNAAASTSESAGNFSAITEQYVADATALFEQFGATYEGIYNKVSGWFEPFESASISVRTNINDMMKAMQSQIDFNNAYTANLQALKEYGLGDLAEAFQSYGANGAAYAQAIVDAVGKAGGATTEEGQKIIQGFSDMNQQVAESQGELTQTIALMNGEFETELQNLVDTYGIAIDGLDKSDEAKTAATNTFDAFLQGINNKIPGILSTMTRFGQQITSSLKNGIGSSVSVAITPLNGSYIPGFATGLDFVPYDNFLAYLHHGEAVLTKEEATAWRAGKEMASSGNNDNSGSGGGGVTVNQYIETVAQTPVELASATAAYFEQARWVT